MPNKLTPFLQVKRGTGLIRSGLGEPVGAAGRLLTVCRPAPTCWRRLLMTLNTDQRRIEPVDPTAAAKPYPGEARPISWRRRKADALPSASQDRGAESASFIPAHTGGLR